MKTPGVERGRAGVSLLAVSMHEQEITSTKAIVRERLTMKFTAAFLVLAVSNIKEIILISYQLPINKYFMTFHEYINKRLVFYRR